MLYLAKKSPNKFFGIPDRLVSSLRGKSIFEIASYIKDNLNGKPQYRLAMKEMLSSINCISDFPAFLLHFLQFYYKECLI